MSGGFYGVSATLARRMANDPMAKMFTRGIEDLQTGKLIQAVAAKSRSQVDVLAFENGMNWCHFKNRSVITPAILSGEKTFVGADSCTKR